MPNNSDLYLIFALEIGCNYKNEYEYELIFSKSPNQIDFNQLQWNEVCKDNVLQPEEIDIDKVIRIVSKYKLIPLHDSYINTYVDGYYRIISLLYEDTQTYNENTMNYDTLRRIVFHYGDTYDEVQELLNHRDIKVLG